MLIFETEIKPHIVPVDLHAALYVEDFVEDFIDIFSIYSSGRKYIAEKVGENKEGKPIVQIDANINGINKKLNVILEKTSKASTISLRLGESQARELGIVDKEIKILRQNQDAPNIGLIAEEIRVEVLSNVIDTISSSVNRIKNDSEEIILRALSIAKDELKTENVTYVDSAVSNIRTTLKKSLEDTATKAIDLKFLSLTDKITALNQEELYEIKESTIKEVAQIVENHLNDFEKTTTDRLLEVNSQTKILEKKLIDAEKVVNEYYKQIEELTGKILLVEKKSSDFEKKIASNKSELLNEIKSVHKNIPKAVILEKKSNSTQKNSLPESNFDLAAFADTLEKKFNQKLTNESINLKKLISVNSGGGSGSPSSQSSGNAEWGTITGDINAQVDLGLNYLKRNSPSFYGTLSGDNVIVSRTGALTASTLTIKSSLGGTSFTLYSDHADHEVPQVIETYCYPPRENGTLATRQYCVQSPYTEWWHPGLTDPYSRGDAADSVRGVAYDITGGITSLQMSVTGSYMNGGTPHGIKFWQPDESNYNIITTNGRGRTTGGPHTGVFQLPFTTEIVYGRERVLATYPRLVENTATSLIISKLNFNTIIRHTSSSSTTFVLSTFDLHATETPFVCTLEQASTGQITISAAPGITVNNVYGLNKTVGQHARVSIYSTSSATYNISGDLTA